MNDQDAGETGPHRIQLPVRAQVDTKSTDTVLNDLRQDRLPEGAEERMGADDGPA